MMQSAVPEFELQQELQRFTTQFADRITQATDVLERSPRADVRDEALRKNLLYVSSAMEIASGPFPEVSLLDMIVFIRLSRTILTNHWMPHLYGDAAAELADVFSRSEQELDDLAAQALTPAQIHQLDDLVDAWLAENPDQVRVEGIRLSDFSAAAGSAAAERASQAKGLLSSVKVATRAANQALMLSERGLFLFHRLPFLWRLQARLAARQMLGDAVTQLSEGPTSPLARLTQQVHDLKRRTVVYLGALGALVVALWLIAWFMRR